ncbi:type IV toxin-antitoxin system AbiEi family antitoxin domain-containing protein [Nocardioides endophyticus]|uniref:Type IV toxin-antitoxin system AbiEi family antitoxin domain-containing protein n=1 Tax=Nocardioides endophyticus TaxID=1353775 RepID=A0ABP8ZEK2_9ACTN
MDPLRYLVAEHGFFTRAWARDVGYDDRDVAREVRNRRWHRIRRGYYTFCDVWAALDPAGKHWVTACAVAHSLGDKVALSHVSGAVGHGLDVWGHDLRRIHVTRLDGGPGRVEGDVVHHEGRCLEDDLTEVRGVRLVVPERSAIEAASRATNEVALATFDSLLRRELATPDELMRRFELMEHWPFTRHLHLVVRMADGRSGSVGESRGRHLFWACRIPAPELQYEVRDAFGALIGTTDWAWPNHGLLGEFDGWVKYGRLLKAGQQAGDVVFAEKIREDRLRERTGWGVIRLVWSDLDAPAATAERVRGQLRRAG